MKSVLFILASSSAATLLSCGGDSAGGSIEPPPIEDIFQDSNQDGMVGDPYQVYDSSGRLVLDEDGQPIYETLYLFDDARLRELCLWPDADSFDDYYEYDQETGRVIIQRGTTPVSEDCPADGIVTGPMHEELMPSSWCRIQGCVP